MLGWGTVLPYQYAYAAHTRGWGGLVAALAASLFSVGALAAAPVGGRLADRHSPALVAILTKLVAALAAAWLTMADTPATFVTAMAVFGFGVAAGGPAQSVLVLHRVSSESRRGGAETDRSEPCVALDRRPHSGPGTGLLCPVRERPPGVRPHRAARLRAERRHGGCGELPRHRRPADGRGPLDREPVGTAP